MWHFLLMMLAPPNAGMRLAMSQSSTTLASHAFPLPSFALAFAILFGPVVSLVQKGIRRYEADPWQHCSLKPSQMQPASVGACAFLCPGASTLCKLQNRGHSLMMGALLHRSFWCDVAINWVACWIWLKSELQASCHSMSLSDLLMAHSNWFGEQSSLPIWTFKMSFFFVDRINFWCSTVWRSIFRRCNLSFTSSLSVTEPRRGSTLGDAVPNIPWCWFSWKGLKSPHLFLLFANT